MTELVLDPVKISDAHVSISKLVDDQTIVSVSKAALHTHRKRPALSEIQFSLLFRHVVSFMSNNREALSLITANHPILWLHTVDYQVETDFVNIAEYIFYSSQLSWCRPIVQSMELYMPRRESLCLIEKWNDRAV